MGLFLSTLAVIVAWQILTGGINLKGLLDKPDPTGKISLFQAQLLVVFVLVALIYMIQLLLDPSHFPVISKDILSALLISNLFYIFGLFWSVK